MLAKQFWCFQFVCFVALRPKLTAMVKVGRSVHLTTLFPKCETFLYARKQ